ncbi:hypothetical protein AB0F17_21840 [Nonomuraea sp. NPDC026600]|uniref:hypothetical protein n=1 Tax=Nonomuraea sp. NPDC026600 TaxID=3155363 RepID=UPI0033C2849A
MSQRTGADLPRPPASQGEPRSRLAGHFADPALAVFDGRYYLYPTTDGTAERVHRRRRAYL